MRVLLVILVVVAHAAGLRLGVNVQHAPCANARCVTAPRMLDHEGVERSFSGDDESIKRDADLVFACVDKDGDNAVSREELSEHMALYGGYAREMIDKIFDRADSSDDGVISQEEFRTLFLTTPSLRTAPGLGSSDDGQIGEKIRMDATNFIAAADASRDGEIGQAELESYMAKLGFKPDAIAHVFAQLDLDDDGVLSRDELAEVFLKYSALRMALRIQGPIVSLD